jgi:hypothetical protein
MAEDFVFVSNLGEINSALRKLGPTVAKASRIGLRQAAEPVRQDAGRLSQLEISGMRRAKRKPPPWSIQKTGQNIHEVYIVPRQKGTRGDPRNPRSRPNFSEIMLGKAYEPALERNRARVVASVDSWLGKVIDGFNTGGF